MAGDLDKRLTERTHQKYCICLSEDHLVEKCPNPPKENEKKQKQVRFIEKGNHACNNGESNTKQNIYASMARLYGNDKCPSGNFGDSSQLTN